MKVHIAFTIEKQREEGVNGRVLYQLTTKIDRRPIEGAVHLGTLDETAAAARFIVHECLTDNEALTKSPGQS